MNYRQQREDNLMNELESIEKRLTQLDKVRTSNDVEIRMKRIETNQLQGRSQEIQMMFRIISA